MYARYFKRTLDIVFSFLFLIIFSPVMLVTALLVKINLGSPVIFKQRRPGLNGEIFVLYKFRSMKNEYDNKGNLLTKNERMTRFGRILRSTSLDELPELWNILKGDMSFIGPRPLLEEYLDYYSSEESRRHQVRPGLSNVSAVSGRATLSWEDSLKLDTWYVDNIGFLLDLKILIKTFFVVLKRENITSNRGKFSDYIKNREAELLDGQREGAGNAN